MTIKFTTQKIDIKKDLPNSRRKDENFVSKFFTNFLVSFFYPTHFTNPLLHHRTPPPPFFSTTENWGAMREVYISFFFVTFSEERMKKINFSFSFHVPVPYWKFKFYRYVAGTVPVRFRYVNLPVRVPVRYRYVTGT